MKAILGITLAMACSSCGGNAGMVAKDVTIGIADFTCLVTTYETDINTPGTDGGVMSDTSAILDAGEKCGIIPSVANPFLNAHIAAKQKGMRK